MLLIHISKDPMEILVMFHVSTNLVSDLSPKKIHTNESGVETYLVAFETLLRSLLKRRRVVIVGFK